MPITLGANINSLRVQTELAKNSKSLSSVLERLSSGLRITRASDDPAGLALASSIRTDVRVHTQAIRNLADGLSLLAIAEQAIGSLSDITTRLQELAQQAANGVYSSTQREALDTEGRSLVDEYNRILATTEFNGINVFGGTTSQVVIQAGYGTQNAIAINLPQVGLDLSTVGDGTFGAAGFYATSNGPRSLISGDFNDDGIIDIASASELADRLDVFLGNGDGSFKTRVEYVTQLDPDQLVTADFNNDGALDIITGDEVSNNISVFLNNGDGSFKAAVSYAAITPIGISYGDFNGDLIPDVITVSQDTDSAYVLINNGNGTFKAATVHASGNAAANPQSVTTGDFNGDGQTDFITLGKGSDAIAIHLNTGGGTFAAAVGMAALSDDALTNTDLNGDGRLDLIAVDPTNDRLAIMLGNGNGTFQAAVNYVAGDSPVYLTLGDFNSDGDTDIATTSQTETTLSVFLNNGDGTFAARITSEVGFAQRGITAADFDGDNVVDLAVYAHSNMVGVLLGNSAQESSGAGALPLNYFDLTTVAEARNSLEDIQGYADRLATAIGSVGASQSRLQVASSYLYAVRENLEAAGSRILDADLAADVAEMLRLQILQQAAVALLAQANQSGAIVMKLLGQ